MANTSIGSVSSSVQPNALTDVDAQQGVTRVDPTPATQAKGNVVEQAPAAEPSSMEKLVLGQLKDLKPGDSVEVELGGEGAAELALRGEGKAKISAKEGGAFEVEMKVAGMVGLGAELPGLKAPGAEMGASAHVGVTLKAGTTFHFEKPEEVAGFVDAAAASGLKVAGGITGPLLTAGAQQVNALAKDNELSKYVGNLEKVELGLGAEARAKGALEFEQKLGGTHVKAGFEVKGGAAVQTSLEFDRARHVLTLRGEAAVDGKFEMAFGSAVETKGKASYVTEREIPMTDADFKRCVTDPAFLAAKTKEVFSAETHRFIEKEGEVKMPAYVMAYHSKRDLDTGAEHVASEVSVEGAAANASFGLGPAHVHASAAKMHELETASSLEEANAKAEQYVAHEQSLSSELSARRHAAQLH
jgi:hypothetical protein